LISPEYLQNFLYTRIKKKKISVEQLNEMKGREIHAGEGRKEGRKEVVCDYFVSEHHIIKE